MTFSAFFEIEICKSNKFDWFILLLITGRFPQLIYNKRKDQTRIQTLAGGL